MENTNNIMSPYLRAHHVVHRRASSDSLVILKGRNIVKTEADSSISQDKLDLGSHVADPAKTPSSSKELLFHMHSSIKVEQEAPNSDPNPIPVPVPVPVPALAPTPVLPPRMDPKKYKRILANRASAQKSRLKKQERMEFLKRQIDIDRERVNMLLPQVALGDMQNKALIRENTVLKERLAFLEIQSAAKQVEHMALKAERDRLVAAILRSLGRN